MPVLSCVAVYWLHIAHQGVESIGEQDQQPERKHRHARKKPCALRTADHSSTSVAWPLHDAPG